jgi:hypothetical protein
MENNKLNLAVASALGEDTNSSSVGKNTFQTEEMHAEGVYHVQCLGPKPEHKKEYELIVLAAREMIKNGENILGEKAINDAGWMLEEKWTDVISNVVTTVGKNFALDSFLAGSAYTAAFYMGLIGSTGYTGVPVAADTMASHATWQESAAYTQGARPTAAWAAATAGGKSLSSPLSYSINATVTIKGCFLTTVATKSGTTGTLYSAGLFSGGDKVLANLDTLNVSYTTSM